MVCLPVNWLALVPYYLKAPNGAERPQHANDGFDGGWSICLYAQGGRSHRLSDKRIEAITVGITVSGAAMMAMGIPLKLSGDYDSAVLELVAVPDGISGDR